MSTRRKRYRAGKGSRSGIVGLVLFLALAVATTVAVRRTVFVVRDIQVVGNDQIPAADIARLSGIQEGESIFLVEEEAVRRAFSSHGVLSFEGLEVHRPSTVRINVRERKPRASLSYAGMPTVIDEYGYAMEQARELSEGTALPVVTGLRLTACEVGKRTVSEIPHQIESLSATLSQLYALQLAPLISELNVSDLDNLYLMTRGGMMVKLGDMDNMQQKLLWMNSALTQLTAEGAVQGVLDVSSAQSAVFQPHAMSVPQPTVEPVQSDEDLFLGE